MKNHKAPGEDGISAELFKYGGERLAEELHKLTNIIWRSEEMPKEWKTYTIVPLHKKAGKTICSNYRGHLPVECRLQGANETDRC